VIHPDATLWAALDDVATTRIHDGGFTEIPPGTNSSIAWFSSSFGYSADHSELSKHL